ncbi:hypothetical protein NDU88_007277 [Pleurodeles waltl]|uniref:Uncharacterized protein n=1 Tax=Pleurodeles waltl TaxID=8319 RepID=A0AAV7MER9_PLEWA|nr:hypothetical protein NDU88_007277 [Pleurodeles waltl]
MCSVLGLGAGREPLTRPMQHHEQTRVPWPRERLETFQMEMLDCVASRLGGSYKLIMNMIVITKECLPVLDTEGGISSDQLFTKPGKRRLAAGVSGAPSEGVAERAYAPRCSADVRPQQGPGLAFVRLKAPKRFIFWVFARVQRGTYVLHARRPVTRNPPVGTHL